MISLLIIVIAIVSIGASDKTCYWNSKCQYQFFSAQTPYDINRGDFRDHPKLQNCQAVNIWSFNRHGNRNPIGMTTFAMKKVSQLKDLIIEAYETGRSELCAQDIDNFRKWTWNNTLEEATSHLTGVGYEELYGIGKRLRETYPHLLNGSSQDYYFRPTLHQRTTTSAIAFVHGLTDSTKLKLVIEEGVHKDDFIRIYDNCDKFHEDIEDGSVVREALARYFNSNDYAAVRQAVQKRLGITYQLTEKEIFHLYEICRFYRSWNELLQSPWCAAFTDEDLQVLEYWDDVRHYYRNGYGSWMSSKLGEFPLKALYESFTEAIKGKGKKITAYFSHDTMMEMVFAALGMFQDEEPLDPTNIDPNRRWRTSEISILCTNIMAVLNRCQESGVEEYRVQFFHNEKVSSLCPHEGCTWDQFIEKFQPFASASPDICKMDYEKVTDGTAVQKTSWIFVLLSLAWLWRLR